ncbi:Heme-binding domain protein [Meiothermus luteus]|uniref:Heme-binding domain protein n=1 Tax=Meiothermus luteus TaxID=2026184 RepID=A0A399EPZ2_9DEIN|nr:heme-binding domain-containing protein [Meiothermus luteus]RIH84602.1 Heme-binding domain protein [Meiothermus luteus]RMH57845.1 MAG: cytochrome C [Deinococcota bacterium]
MRWATGFLAILGFGALLVGVAIQMVPYGRNHSNPPVLAEPPWDSPKTREMFMAACGDCHSNQTRWPWYSHIAPISWLVQYDVEKGREKLNVSEWGRRKNEGEEVVEAVLEGYMPPGLYTLMHPEARFTREELQAFLAGLRATFGGEDEEYEKEEHEEHGS